MFDIFDVGLQNMTRSTHVGYFPRSYFAPTCEPHIITKHSHNQKPTTNSLFCPHTTNMAEFLAGIGAASSIIGLVEFSAKLVKLITRFALSFRQVPDVLHSAISKVTLWNHNLSELHEISLRKDNNDRLKRVLRESGVLGNAQRCLEHLNDIIKDAGPLDRRRDQVDFRLKAQREMERWLQQLDENMPNLNLALSVHVL